MIILPRIILLAMCVAMVACSKSGSAVDPSERVYQNCIAELKRVTDASGPNNGPAASEMAEMWEKAGRQACEKARDSCRQNPGTPACQ
ncbi:MAG: hypothetical protein JSR34_11750 [Proteobacteria bacterium]|nr:hypothetical protein [Pseudomonadota bacterium]